MAQDQKYYMTMIMDGSAQGEMVKKGEKVGQGTIQWLEDPDNMMFFA